LPSRDEVTVAGGAEQAIRLLDDGFRPKVVRTDVMPGVSGEDLIDELQRRYPGGEIAIVVMSACREALLRVSGKAVARFEKPLDVPTVVRVLGAVGGTRCG